MYVSTVLTTCLYEAKGLWTRLSVALWSIVVVHKAEEVNALLI